MKTQYINVMNFSNEHISNIKVVLFFFPVHQIFIKLFSISKLTFLNKLLIEHEPWAGFDNVGWCLSPGRQRLSLPAQGRHLLLDLTPLEGRTTSSCSPVRSHGLVMLK